MKIYLLTDVSTNTVTPFRKISGVIQKIFGNKPPPIKEKSIVASIRRNGEWVHDNFVVTKTEIE